MNGRLMWCDFGANLVQHFIKRYSRYSRYQTVLSKLQEIIKRSESASLLVSEQVQIAPRAFCEKQNEVQSTASNESKLARSIISTLLNIKNARFLPSIFYYLLENSCDCPSSHSELLGRSYEL